MHPDVQKLRELQDVDQEIASLTTQIETIPSQIKRLEDELNQFLRAHEERQHRLADNQKKRRDLEGDVQEVRAKIAKHKDQLYELKSNEQYRAMLHEIEGEETNMRKIEERILDKMVEAEQLENYVRDAAARLDGERARVAAEKKHLETERARSEASLHLARERRGALAAALSETLFRLYERIRKARGVAVVPVVDGSCAGCHVMLRPQAYNEVRAGESLTTCESCGRILYYLELATDKASEGTRVALS